MAVCASIGGLLAVIAREQPDTILIEPTREANSIVLREVQRQAPGARIVLWVDNLSTVMAMEAMVMGMRGNPTTDGVFPLGGICSCSSATSTAMLVVLSTTS